MRILHLSDIHYGMRTVENDVRKEQVSAHVFVHGGSGVPNPATLAEIITRDPTCSDPDIIVVSGDVGWSGARQDYEYALAFLRSLRHAWPSIPLLIVPGNHDVDRQAAEAGQDPQAAYVDMLRQLYDPEFEHHYPLYATSAGIPSSRQRLVAVEYLPGALLVVGVNSAASFLTEDNPVYVEPGVLQMIADHIQTLHIPRTALRVFVIHHHLFPFAEPPWGAAYDASQVPDAADPTILANSAKLQAWLADNDFFVVLHGHKHLSHGRDDVLWRHEDPSDGRRLFVVGAGSAGQRVPNEPLSYNVITATRLADVRWDVCVSVRRITDARGVQEATRYYAYRSHVGHPATAAPVVFVAARMDDCHGAISASLHGSGPVRTFISVVEDNTYVHPSTVRIGDRTPTSEEVHSSFRALHPEWSTQDGWDDPEHIDRELRASASRFQFRHGPRLFGIPGRGGEQLRDVVDPGQLRRLQPIRHAIEGLRASDAR